jgi:hypothetical protein
MYSFGNRKDTTIVDEPFYANYLVNHPDLEHPGKDDILKSQAHDFDEVLQNVLLGDYQSDVIFIKNMAHHLDQQDWSFLKKMANVFLIREPKRLIASFAKVIPNPTLLDIGLGLEFEIFKYLESNNLPIIVLDSHEVLKSPRKVLNKLCDQLGISFDEEMLSWSAGPRKEDGLWAKYWYASVHKSTGFTLNKISNHPFPNHLNELLEEATVYYNKLQPFTIKAD